MNGAPTLPTWAPRLSRHAVSARHGCVALVAALVALLPGLALADEYSLGGGFTGDAKVDASAVYRNNYFYSDNDPISATGYRVRPEIGVARNGANARFTLSANLEQSDYDLPGNLDNYLNYGAKSGLVWLPLTRHRFDLTGQFQHGHDAAGLQRTEGIPNFGLGQLDEWDQGTAYLTYRYGAEQSLGSNTLRVGGTKRQYSNNRNNTAFLDFLTRAIDYELAFEYSPRTAIIFQLGQRDTNYSRSATNNIANRNGNELSARAGVRWVATGKTSGELQVGVRDYSVDSRARPSRQTLTWKARVNWNPTKTTEFDFSTGETSTETFRADAFLIEERKVGGTWRQTWTPLLKTTAGGDYTQSKFIGSGREDDYFSAYVGFDVLLSRQITVYGQYLTRHRNSSLPGRDFDAPESSLGLRWNL